MFKFFENLIDPYQPYKEIDQPPQKLFPFLKMYLEPFKKLFAITAVLSIITAAIEILLISYLGRLVTALSEVGPNNVWQEYGVELAVTALLILFVRPVLQALDTLMQNNALLPNVGTIVRYRAHKHVLKQSITWFENDFAGRISNRIMQTPPATGEVVFQAFDAITFSLAYLVGALIMLSSTDSQLALPLLFWVCLYAALIVWTIKRVGPASKASSAARSEVTGRVVDSYTNIHSVKMFDHNDGEMSYAKDSIEAARQTFQKEMRLYTIMDVGLVTLNGALVVGVVGWAVWLWSNGNAALGVVAAAAALTLRLNGMSGWIMWATTTVFRELGVISEGMQTIATPIELIDKPKAKTLDHINGQIDFVDVSHHYGQSVGGLDKVSLTIKPGEKVGLVGASGAGKSTLIKLILRFYDAESGQVMIDGHNVQDVTQASLRSFIGMVQQEGSLLHRSVRDNIKFGMPQATHSQVEMAIMRAQAQDFIATLVDQYGNEGLDALVGERGVKLSGGQRQRIALARVLLKDAPILILDEATSALDSGVEAEILDTFYDFMTDKTVIAIAHRLSTIAKMDRIIVLDKGKIIEQGSHAELVKLNGAYANLWKLQSGGFIG